ncbi:MAG: GDYXXLXY domain-containing protein, partial [Bacteroidota bacterium]
LMVLLQLAVPASMIFSSEEILNKGTVYKFKTAPVDPSDPFRGKYITLNFAVASFPIDSSAAWKRGDEIFVQLENDADGFAAIADVSDVPFDEQTDFVKAKIDYRVRRHIWIDYPFDRYYMEESKALPAENLYRESRRDSTKEVYALVAVNKGKAVLQDVQINDESIADLVDRKLLEEAEKVEEDTVKNN